MRPLRNLGRAGIAVLALGVGACGGDAGEAGEGSVASVASVDTLPSGRIVVANPDVPAGEGWTLRELHRVGSLAAEGPEMFGQVSDIELGHDGELYVLDGQASEVRVFEPDGDFRRTLGGFGEGPGELNRPPGMAYGPDGGLWVLNWGNARYTGYDGGSGELVGERPRLLSFVSFPWPGGFDDAGRLIDIGVSPDGQGTVLVRLDTAFVPSDTIPMPDVDERYRVAFRQDGRMMMSTLDAFAPRPFWASRPRGGVVVGEGSTYRLHRVDFSGDTTFTFSLDRPRVRVTDAEADSARAAFRERLETIEATPDREPRVLDEKPAHGPLFVDDEDRTWVRATDGGVAWDVFSADGRYLGLVEAPVEWASSPTVRDGRLAITTTVDEVPVVIVYEIVDGGA